MFYKRICCVDALWSRHNLPLEFLTLTMLYPRSFKAYISRYNEYNFMGLLLVSLLALLPFNSNAAISAITVNAIKGTEPYLVLSDGTKLAKLDELLGFTMPKQDGSSGTEHIDATMADKTIIAPSGMKFSDAVTLVKADGNLYDIPGTKVADDDGDAIDILNTSVQGKIKATWYDGDSKVINLDQLMDGCGGPYKLKVEAPSSVSANTLYGNPRVNVYGTHPGITYNFKSNAMKICYLKPVDLTVNTGTEGVDIEFASGYNPAVWTANKGFKASSQFPSTGFYKAQFAVLGPGDDQTKYRCQLSVDDGRIVLSGASSKNVGKNCTITYNSKTKAEFIAGSLPTIDMYYNSGDTPETKIDSYQIPQPKKWAISGGSGAYKTDASSSARYTALDTCRQLIDGVDGPAITNSQGFDTTPDAQNFRQKYLYRMNELTNNPYAKSGTYQEGNYSDTLQGKGFFSRDVDQTFIGEWGDLTKYTGSSFSYGVFWSAEMWIKSKSTIGGVNVKTGALFNNGPYDSSGIICRGE